jgi:cytoskeletal protein RodZ
MKINSENCEAWFLDYYEGNLSEERAEEMFAYLEENPEMQELFDSYEPFSFQPDKGISFDGKADLKKPEHTTEGINQSNYEEYFVSYTEGLLNADGKKMVEDFLVKFPSHRHELDLLKLAILSPEEEIVFEQKDALKKTLAINAENFDEMAIASVEGLLNREEEKMFSMAVAANEEQQRTYSLYHQTRLSPDTSIVFENKESLKKKERGALWWLIDTRFAAAAAVALIIGILYWNFSGKDTVMPKDVTAYKNPTRAHDPSADSGKNPLADAKTNSASDSNASPAIVNSHVIAKQIGSNKYAYDVQKDNKAEAAEPREPIVTRRENIILASNVNTQVDFSGAYYDVAQYKKPAPAPASNDISLRQAAMRWVKKKLDRSATNEPDEEATYTAAVNPGENHDVNGFDLTSSAVSALGNATGTNLKLGHEQEGTVLTVGKYELLLNRN